MFSTREKEKERLVLSHLCNILNLIIICVVPSAPFHLYMPYMCKMKVYLRERDRERERAVMALLVTVHLLSSQNTAQIYLLLTLCPSVFLRLLFTREVQELRVSLPWKLHQIL